MLTFPPSYFKGEEIDGFFVEEMMKRAWAAQMEVLCEFDRVCKKHGLLWFADYGTLLGAVRHKGFVPWDDDIDIAMPRQDMIRFMKVARKELPEGYTVLTPWERDDFNQIIYRVLNGTSIVINEEHLKRYHGCPFAVGLDLSPLDYIPDNEDDRQLQVDLLVMTYQAGSAWTDPDCTEEERWQLTEQVEETLNRKLDRNKPIAVQLFQLADALSGMYGPEDGSRVSIPYRQSYCGDRAVFPAEWYASSVKLPFEVMEIEAPVGWEGILRKEYGDYEKKVRFYRDNYPFYARQLKVAKEWLAAQGLTLKDVGVPGTEEEDVHES